MDFPVIRESFVELSPELHCVQLLREVRLAKVLHGIRQLLREDVELCPPGKHPVRIGPVINTYVLDGLVYYCSCLK